MDMYPTPSSSSTTTEIISGIKSKNDDNGDGDDYRKQVEKEKPAAKKKASRSLALLKRQIRHHMNNAVPGLDPIKMPKRDGPPSRLLGHVSDTDRKGRVSDMNKVSMDNEVPILDPREMRKKDRQDKYADPYFGSLILKGERPPGRRLGLTCGVRKGRLVNGHFKNDPLPY